MGGRAPGISAAQQLRVRLLGSVEVSQAGKRLRAFDAPRLQRFLGLLILRPALAHRSRLAFELWPDSDERQARTNLRKLLHEFRQALPHSERFVEIDTEVVRWITSSPATVDVADFISAAAEGDLEVAARSYTGDLLPACYDDWVLEERAKLRSEAHATFLRLAQDAAAANDHDAAIEHAQRAIELDPTDESAVRLEMEVNLGLGRRAAALRCYHRLAEVLERDLGVVPGESIDRLYQEIRSGPERVVATGAHGQLHVTESPFVGRQLELSLMYDLWTRTREAGAHFVVVTGEPGIGKSRLADELGRRVRAEGHAVAAARAYEAAGNLPFGPVVDLLRSEALSGHIETLDGVWKTELARVLPELTAAIETDAPEWSSDQGRRRRLFDAVRHAIVADDRPRLLIVDDLQWCDADTVELIGFVLRAGASAPVLIVGTLRSEEVPPDHPVNHLVDALVRDRLVTAVSLDPLDEQSTARLAAVLNATAAVEPELAARLWAETEGNPLFVIEALRAGLPKDGSTLLTPTMRAVMGARLGQLSDDARKLAEVAAVIGRPFSESLLASATGTGEESLVECLDELWRRRIIRDQGRTYDFSHDKLRAVALEMVPPARRRRIHRKLAEALTHGPRRDGEAAAAQLAAHYDQAGMVEEAIDAYRAAGARAASVSALEEAVTMFGRALALLADLPASRERDSLELDIRLAIGSPLVSLRGYGSRASHQLYERALSLSRKLGRSVDPPILRGLGLARLQGCRFEDASDMGQALVDFDRADQVSVTEGRYLLGVSAFWRGDLLGARSHLQGAISTYDPANTAEHLALYAQDPQAVCLVRLGWTHLWAGDPGRADEAVGSALERAADLDHLMTSWYVLTYATIIAAECDDLAHVGELLEQAERLGRRFPLPYLMIVGDALQGWLEASSGSSDGIGAIEDAVARSRVEGESLHLSYTLLLLARAHHLFEGASNGRAATREGLAWTHDHDQHYLEAELWRADGELASAGGDADGAQSSLSKAVDVASTQGARWLELRALVTLARLFPDQQTLVRLERRRDAIRYGHDLPAFRAATALLASEV